MHIDLVQVYDQDDAQNLEQSDAGVDVMIVRRSPLPQMKTQRQDAGNYIRSILEATRSNFQIGTLHSMCRGLSGQDV
jgi:hypothetical protein